MAAEAAADSCATCKFWLTDPKSKVNGPCRRYPPVICAAVTIMTATFPSVPATGWCGEFSKIVPAAK